MIPARLRIHDPGLVALRSAVRAAIVMPAVFAFVDRAIDNPRAATFAAFGSVALLVFVDFGGPLRSRLIAYLALAAVGVLNITLGTLCSHNALLAAAAMAVVGFAILFSGVINGYFAAAATAAMLTFILAVTIPAPLSDAPARLEGWLIAAAVCISAQLLLWPQRRGTSLRAGAARACRELAELADAVLAHDDEAVAERTRAAGEAVDALRRAFLSTPHRPTGPTRAEAALSSLVDELDWLFSLLAPPLEQPGLQVCRTEQADAVAASVDALRAASALLDGDEAQPDFERLAETRDALVHALVRQIPELPPVPDDDTLVSALQPVFRIRGLSFGTRDVAVHALEIAGRKRSVRSTIRATEHLTADLASARSVWFRNSLRGAVGVAIAVYVAQRSGLQHAFWVVLGTLSSSARTRSAPAGRS
jgi:uncharacterized membrane protein YccC